MYNLCTQEDGGRLCARQVGVAPLRLVSAMLACYQWPQHAVRVRSNNDDAIMHENIVIRAGYVVVILSLRTEDNNSYKH